MSGKGIAGIVWLLGETGFLQLGDDCWSESGIGEELRHLSCFLPSGKWDVRA